MPKLTYVSDLFDLTLLNEMIRDGYITDRRHAWMPLSILNYTPKAQIERVWNAATLQCRGLIVDDDGFVLARPFPKFFNLGEPCAPEPPTSAFDVYDKRDGSLGIIYEYAEAGVDHVCVSTRGSFHSDQAAHASAWLRKNRPLWFPSVGLTFLVEIIYPANRIVVDYGNADDLVLIGIVDTESGQMLPYETWTQYWPGTIVPKYDRAPIEWLQNNERANAEGYVLYWPKENVRLKVKHEEYKRLHKLLTNITERTIWEQLSNGQNIDYMLDCVPDEFYQWARGVAANLQEQYEAVKTASTVRYLDALRFVNDVAAPGSREHRKLFAMATEGFDDRGVLFAMYDNRPYDELIWKSIKPPHTKPWKEDNTDA